eukprot:TRINITY_DN2595_c0_g1_i5.p1 TRINITY_DN2595_c0_g1~~TRINITY_DN2595_c0_g1_i5.p1  ORF type:complete len:1233 (-),score=277.39 TRINITY_DN2595_c0_g1_i5:368-4066(-)
MSKSKQSNDHEDEEPKSTDEVVVDRNPDQQPKRAEAFFESYTDVAKKRGDLKLKDMWMSNQDTLSKTTYEQFHQLWNEEIKQNSPSIFGVIQRIFWKPFAASYTLFLLYAVFSYVLPLIVPHMVQFLQDPTQEFYLGYVYCAVVFVASILGSLCYYHSLWISIIIGLKVRTILMTAVYGKVLKMSKISGAGSGQIINLYAADSQHIFDAIMYYIPGFGSPLMVLGAIVILGFSIGWYCLIALAVCAISVPVALKLGFEVGVLRRSMQVLADQRLKLCSELIQGIRIVKYSAWERPFIHNIELARKREVQTSLKLAVVRWGIMFCINNAPTLTITLIFLFYGLFSTESLTVSTAFTVISLVNITRVPIQWAAVGYLMWTQNKVSIQRVGEFLLTPEKKEYVQNDPDMKEKIKIKNATFNWNPADTDKAFLQNINLKIKKGQKVMVIGAVGSGKSSLSMAILGEIPLASGEIYVNDDLAYVPQQAWIFNGTVRDNIIFGMPYDDKKFKAVCAASALNRDLEQWIAGDLTEIGERGVNMSGGQRQRVSIARALYSEKKIVILDDPLSAVDSHVSKYIFKHAIQTYLADRTVVMITNQLQYLPLADHIVVMNQGKIDSQGKFNDLMDKSKLFSELMKKFGVMEEEEVEKENTDKKTKKVEKKEEHAVAKVTATESEQIKKGGLVKVEERSSGLIPFSVYWYYMKSGGLRWAFLFFLCFLVYVVIRILGSWWLATWSSKSQAYELAMRRNDTDIEFFDNSYWTWSYIGWMIAESMSQMLALAIGLSLLTVSSAKTLHKKILIRISYAKTAFFDSTPVGRIFSRLSQDMSLIDFLLGINFCTCTNIGFMVFTTLVGIGLGTWYILLVALPLVFVYIGVQVYYRSANIEVQRIEAITRAPPISLLSATLNGIDTIRAYKSSNRFIQICFKQIDNNNRVKFVQRYGTMWFGVLVDFVGACLILILFLGLSLVRNYWVIDPSFAALAMSYTSGFITALSGFSTAFAELEMRMNSVERFKEYNKLAQEKEESDDGYQPPDEWPSKGEIEFKDFSFAYHIGPPVLKNLSFKIKSQHKIGVVGRTGAGKSSMMQALFRIEEPVNGTIVIDNVDITQLGLHDLRSSISIIPQDPTLFIGTVRYNLDPFDEHDDKAIWDSLKLVELHDTISNLKGQLDFVVTENGSNFSVGQRQLLCMARALLRKTKILLLDEATASVDVETGMFIDHSLSQTIRNYQLTFFLTCS